ncbi:hypothetical protein AB1Y20_002442 [Prymnesium parvum]|uniref:Presenilin n=1 Tax=Prymnesium parvum TaxID=97485 RepID=A0AB34JAW6_PRYPA
MRWDGEPSRATQPLLSDEERMPTDRGAPAAPPPAGASADAPDSPLRELQLQVGRSGSGSSGSSSSDALDDDTLTAGSSVASLLRPVTLTIALTVFLVHSLAGAPDSGAGGFSQLMVYRERDGDASATVAGGVLLNALVMVGTLFGVTTALLVLYKLRCYLVIYSWLIVSVGSLLFLFGGFVAQQLLEVYAIALDWPTGFFCMYNFAVVGTFLVFWSELGCGPYPPRAMQQGYLVVVAALLAWTATKLPEWSTWGMLVAVSSWDVVAVLLPQGPLKMLVEEAERRNEPIPGLVYEGANIKLGLGDFVFYSVLVGRASMSSVTAATACTVAVLTGLCATLALLPIIQRVLPALPISIAAGIGFYFSTVSVLTPLINFISSLGLTL